MIFTCNYPYKFCWQKASWIWCSVPRSIKNHAGPRPVTQKQAKQHECYCKNSLESHSIKKSRKVMPIRYYSTLTDVSNFQANFPPFANASWIMKRTASAFIQFNDKSFREFHDAEKSESFVRFSQVHLSKKQTLFSDALKNAWQNILPGSKTWHRVMWRHQSIWQRRIIFKQYFRSSYHEYRASRIL